MQTLLGRKEAQMHTWIYSKIRKACRHVLWRHEENEHDQRELLKKTKLPIILTCQSVRFAGAEVPNEKSPRWPASRIHLSESLSTFMLFRGKETFLTFSSLFRYQCWNPASFGFYIFIYSLYITYWRIYVFHRQERIRFYRKNFKHTKSSKFRDENEEETIKRILFCTFCLF